MNTLIDTLIEAVRNTACFAMVLGLLLPLLAFSGLAPSYCVLATPFALAVNVVAFVVEAIATAIADRRKI